MQRQGRPISAERPGARVVLVEQVGISTGGIHCSVRELCGVNRLPAGLAAENSLYLARAAGINLADGGAGRDLASANQRIPERFCLGTAAFKTGPMPARERGGLIQEEEFGIKAGLHELAAPALEFQTADDPALAGPLPVFQCTVFPVEAAAPVSHEAAPFGHCMQQPERISAVLKRQG